MKAGTMTNRIQEVVEKLATMQPRAGFEDLPECRRLSEMTDAELAEEVTPEIQLELREALQWQLNN